ncbi:MAG: magnesium transporter [Dehalococcoidia bacterium]|nr:magnesium transporter [Dehalococcoidia bacterium]
MIYLSELLNRPVRDTDNRKVGNLRDLVVSVDSVFPTVVGLVVHLAGGRPLGRETTIIPWSQVTNLEENQVYLNVPQSRLDSYQPQEGQLLLSRDILDKQILDTRGRRIVKVNDLKLAQIRGSARLIGADVSLAGFLRRLGVQGIERLLPFKLPERLVTWNYVEPLESELGDVRLKIPYSKLAELHPADIADILEQMDVEEGVSLLESLSAETAAEVLTEVESPFQADLVEEMDVERASDLLEIMPPDEATDILGDISQPKADEIISHMESEEAAEVRDLLRYHERTAGGLMTPEVFRVQKSATVEETIALLRQMAPLEEVVYYLFVVDGEDRLAGVVSLRDLVTSRPDTALQDIMDEDVIRVRVDTDQEEVAQTIAKYNLLAVPVTDPQDRLLGMVTVDDVIDVIREEATEDISQMSGTTSGDVEHTSSVVGAAAGRMGWLVAGLAGGALSGLLLKAYSPSLGSLQGLVYFIPLLLLVGGEVVAQTSAVVARALSLGMRRGLVWREVGIAAMLAATSGLLAGVFSYALVGRAVLMLVVGASLFLTLLAAALLGGVLPILLRNLKVSPTLVGRPVLQPVVAIVSILIYLSLSTSLYVHLV